MLKRIVSSMFYRVHVEYLLRLLCGKRMALPYWPAYV